MRYVRFHSSNICVECRYVSSVHQLNNTYIIIFFLLKFQEPTELDDVLVEDFDNFNSKSSPDSNNHQASPQPKKKRLEPSSLSEQEQIALAIGNSLREVTAGEDKDNDSFGEDDEDGDSDFENYDDESSNQSYVKSQTSQNAFDTKLHVVSENNEAECEPPKANDVASTANTIETYESYLGDENGRCCGLL